MDSKSKLSAVFVALFLLTDPFSVQAEPLDKRRINDCFLDDPAPYLTLLDKVRAESTRENRLRVEDLDDAQKACDLTEDSQTYPEEIALPMPCGRRMIMRRVRTPGSGPLDQTIGYFGDLDAQLTGDTYLLSTAPWDAPVAGSFHGEDGQSAYYIGKYEVTAPQWGLFTSGLFDLPPSETAFGDAACASFTEAALRDENGRPLKPVKVPPARNINWFDAIAYSRAYSSWLVAYDHDRIAAGKTPITPWNSGSPGFLRLPTEAEWELAARGGEAGKEGRSKRLHDMIDSHTGQTRTTMAIEDIAYLESTQHQELIDGVGRRSPNGRYIYDMIGNVEEIVLDLFRMVRPDGLHGQPGGYVVRGGSSVTPGSEIGVGIRREIPLVDADGISSSRFVGFRLLLSAPVFTPTRAEDGTWTSGDLDRAFTERALEARKSLTLSVGDPKDDRSRLLQDLAALRIDTEESTQSPEELRSRLAELQSLLETSNAKIHEFEINALRDRAVSSMAIAWSVRQTGQRLYLGRSQVVRVLEGLKKSGMTPKELRDVEEKSNASVRRIRGELEAQYTIYLEGVQDLADLNLEQLDEILKAAHGIVDNRGADAFGDAPKWLSKHAREAATHGGEITEQMRQSWFFEVDEYRQRRLDKFGPLR